MIENAQWFEPTQEKCQSCKNRATGVLRGTRNESYGPYCKRCAEKEIKQAQARRLRLTERWKNMLAPDLNNSAR